MKPKFLLLSFILGFALSSAIAYFAWTHQPSSLQATTAASNVHIDTSMTMAKLLRERRLRIYFPPGYENSNQHYPVLYMHDGQNLFDAASAYAGEWGIDETLNSLALTHGLKLIVVGIDNGGDKRMTELNPFDHERFGASEADAYLDFIVEQVKPWVDQNYRSLSGREHTAIMGSSMGGLISHYAAIRHADVFSKAGIFSPAYWTAPAFTDFLIAHPVKQSQRLFLLMGEAEGGSMMADFEAMKVTLEAVRSSQPEITSLAISVAHAQHNELFWRSQFAPAALWLFTPPTVNAQTGEPVPAAL
ncbi:alpha/beta hydrolase-fold protein [Simiduia curdlanivorans]|uniref:Alpha/beta hydrolase n=1 Tax=Simiduia curdlanivorans TaxID=1492769 RepID=A0ABV8V5K6_9GAMM|nr:alpha/beta hydrolase-fold protein [Simiduia curdlanivorans]MDN3638219.1 alpha/beta hydrolase-fold protein [Simiduia curdlanivorans]